MFCGKRGQFWLSEGQNTGKCLDLKYKTILPSLVQYPLHCVGFCAYLTLGNIVKIMCCCYNKSEKWMAENQIIKHSSNSSLCDCKCQGDSVNLGAATLKWVCVCLIHLCRGSRCQKTIVVVRTVLHLQVTLTDPKYFHEHELNTCRGHFLHGRSAEALKQHTGICVAT